MKKKIIFLLLAQCLCIGLFAQTNFDYELEKAKRGDAAAQYKVGNCYYNGEGVRQDYSEAYKWYMKAAEQGNAQGQDGVGDCYFFGKGVIKDDSKAFEWYMKAAEQGDAKGQDDVGWCYYHGYGVSRDYSEAYKWYMKAVEQGNVQGQEDVGYCYYYGNGVNQDYSEAFECFMKAAEQGNAEGQNNVGYCYSLGNGVCQDYSEAYKWHMKAAEQEDAQGQYNVGCCYYLGNGVSQDYSKAFEWFIKAAEQGYRDAQIQVCDCYYKGEGVSQNYSEAFEWYIKALNCLYYPAALDIEWSKMKRKMMEAIEQGNLEAERYLERLSSIVYNGFDPAAPPSIDFVANSLQFVDANSNNAIDAEEKCTISVQVTNSGKGPGRECVAKITAESNVPGVSYSNIDIPYLAEGETTMIEIPLTANMQTENGIAKFSIQIDEPNGFGTDAVSLSVNTRAFVAPMIKVVDFATVSANGSSVLAKKSAFDLQLLLQNVEAGKAENVKVSIEVPENVFLMETQGQQSFSSMDGGEVKKITYSLIANNNYAGNSIPVKVNVKEKHGKYAESRTIDLPLNQTIRNHNIVLEEKSGDGQRKDIQIASIGSDVDKNIPSSTVRNDRTFAVIIANENYNKEANVPYAVNDGNVFSEYCSTTLGVPTNNIHLVRNATLNDIRHEVNWITNVMDASGGKAKVLFYYAGHGIPDERTRTAYLLPVDGYGSDVATGYPLANLYSALGETPSQSVTVFLDACFSGTKREGDMMASARGVAIKVNETSPVGNMVVFSASQGDETAYPYTEQGHGLFTYYLLKKLQDTAGNVTLGELSDYVIEQVKLQSVVINSKPQTPTIIPSPNMSDSWRSETLK